MAFVDAHSLRISLLIGFLALAVGCDSSGPQNPVDEFPADPDLPEAVVDLPAPPPESAFEIREFNDDGTLRVEGVISNREKYIREEVNIRGFVGEIRGDDCDPAVEYCPSPHLFIRDHIDEDQQLMVVGYRNDLLSEAGIEVGSEHIFRGVYDQTAHGFVSSEMGLLSLRGVDDQDL